MGGLLRSETWAAFVRDECCPCRFSGLLSHGGVLVSDAWGFDMVQRFSRELCACKMQVDGVMSQGCLKVCAREAQASSLIESHVKSSSLKL